MHLPAYRFGKPYESLERDTLVHFLTGEPVAEVSQVGGAIVGRDLQKAAQARRALLAIDPEEIVERLQTAGNLYANGTVTVGDTKQSPADFVKQQSATTGLPESLCRANMQKNMFVLSNMDRILDALSRGLDTKVLWSGYGTEHRGVTVSYQAQSPVLGLVLPSNSPGVHTLWLPVIALGVGLVMKPGSQEPWTPYRMAAAMVEAGIPAEAIGLYPGATDVGAGVLVGAQAVDGGIEAQRRTRIGARDDQEVLRRTRGDGGLDAGDGDVERLNQLAFHMAAFLRPFLVFELQRGGASSRVPVSHR